MSYTDDAVRAKLSALSETQESIVTVAQWIMFHKRHADRTVQLWLQRLKDSNSHKRLNLIYLANEVTQQSKARRKEDFLDAFSPSIAEAVATAYKGAPTEIQTRIRRVVDVWRERNVFQEPVQSAVEGRINELDKTRGAAKSVHGGSIFSSTPSLPSELTPLVSPLQSVNKQQPSKKSAVDVANQEFQNLMGAGATVPSAPVYAARLSGLLKTLAQAEGAVEQCVKARRELVDQLQNILNANRTALLADEAELDTFSQHRNDVMQKKDEVEMAIMAGLPDDEPYVGSGFLEQPEEEIERPEIEELTPPAMETDMPEPAEEAAVDPDSKGTPEEATSAPEADITIQQKSVSTTSNGSKKRRLDETDDFPILEGDDIDADVAETLRKDSSGGN